MGSDYRLVPVSMQGEQCGLLQDSGRLWDSIPILPYRRHCSKWVGHFVLCFHRSRAFRKNYFTKLKANVMCRLSNADLFVRIEVVIFLTFSKWRTKNQISAIFTLA